MRFVEVSKATDDFLAALLSQVGAAADRPTVAVNATNMDASLYFGPVALCLSGLLSIG